MRDFFGLPLYDCEEDYKTFPILVCCGSDLLRDESLKWCREHILFDNWCFDPYVAGAGFECRFKHEDDAIIFKLRFSV